MITDKYIDDKIWGSYGKYIHIKIIGQTIDSYKFILKGVNKNNKCHVLIDPPTKIAEYIKSHCKRDDVVVFAGRQSKNAFSLVPKQKVY